MALAAYGPESMGCRNTVGQGEGSRVQETWMGLSSASAFLDDLALVILGGLRILAHPSHPG